MEQTKKRIYGDVVDRKSELLRHYREMSTLLKKSGTAEGKRTAGKLDVLRQRIQATKGDGHAPGAREIRDAALKAAGNLAEAWKRLNDCLWTVWGNPYLSSWLREEGISVERTCNELTEADGLLRRALGPVEKSLRGVVVPVRRRGDRNELGGTREDMLADMAQWIRDRFPEMDANDSRGFLSDIFAFIGIPRPDAKALGRVFPVGKETD